jgi:hypothetical protein
MRQSSYNCRMTSVTDASAVPRFSAAGGFLERFAARDFPGLGFFLSDAVRMRALVPSGLREVAGPREVSDLMAFFFRDIREFELVDASVGAVGVTVYLRWRVRVIGGRFDHWHVVEQQAYANVDDDGLIEDIALVCSGFRSEIARVCQQEN